MVVNVSFEGVKQVKTQNKMETVLNKFNENNRQLLLLVDEWKPRLLNLPDEVLVNRRNKQNRTIKQITGHMVDSASNNTHRIINLQNLPDPLIFPDYANLGNNDRWIDIQQYQNENWHDLVELWKYTNLHFVHVVECVNPEMLDKIWISALNENISLKAMVLDYLRHFKLHLAEIEELINQKTV